MRILHKQTLIAVLVLIASLEAHANALASSPVNQALESAVRIEVVLQWPDKQTSAFIGSGWTRECRTSGNGYELVIATAGHVLDIASPEQESRPDNTSKSIVKVVVIYRDGRQFSAGREDLRVDRVHDYGEVRVHSTVPRTVLPAGVAVAVPQGAQLFTIASPGRLTFSFFEGHVIALEATFVSDAPAGAWLTSIPVAPGASGAPVLDEYGHVVATVVGYVEWPWGGWASIIVALPRIFPTAFITPIKTVEEVSPMSMMDGLLPLMKLGVMGAGAALMYLLLPALRRRGVMTAETIAMITDIARRAVMAVEQAHGHLAGPEKKRLAEEAIGEIVSRMGLQVPRALINVAIESAVLLVNALVTHEQPVPVVNDATAEAV